MTHLEQNLLSLAKVNPALAERLCWSVANQQVRLGTHGGLERCERRVWLPLALDPVNRAGLEQTLAEVTTSLCLGVGDGQAIAELLSSNANARLVVWDRDPWLLRLFLERFELSQALATDRLRLALGTDLLDWPPAAGLRSWIHPAARHQYAPECHWWEAGCPQGRWAMVANGELMVDDLGEALREEGFHVWPLDLGLLSLEEMAFQIQRLQPALLAAINYKNGLAEFADSQGVDLLVWEIDPTTDRLAPLGCQPRRAFVFTYRAGQVAEFQRAGFAHAHYLALATHPRHRHPEVLSVDERRQYQAPISFVGASLWDQIESHRCNLFQLFSQTPGLPPAREWEERLRALLEEQARDFFHYRIPELFPLYFGDPHGWPPSFGPDPIQLVAEISAAEKRRGLLSLLGSRGLQVWGDEGFRPLEASGVRYRGPAGYTQEINKIYSASRINLDLGRLYQSDIVTLRVFDALACGGFILAEDNPSLSKLFQIGRELDTYSSQSELISKVDHYLAHPEAAARIAEHGRARVLAEHSIAARVQTILQCLQKH